MSREKFVKRYNEIVRRAMEYAEKARREGLLSLEGELDQEKIKERDIFEYGLNFVVDGIDAEIIKKILSNIIIQEKDEEIAILKNIQKEAVLMIQEGINPRMLYHVLNSFSDITLKEDEILKMIVD